MHIKLMTGAAALALLLPFAAYAQSGAGGGAVVGGPVGAVVGGVGGAIVGTITDANKPKFREYVVREHHPSYHYDREVVVGAELPATGVTYYEIPRDYGVTEYRYTIVNDRTVIVDPKTHRIVEIIG